MSIGKKYGHTVLHFLICLINADSPLSVLSFRTFSFWGVAVEILEFVMPTGHLWPDGKSLV